MADAPLERTIVAGILTDLRRRGVWAQNTHGSPFASRGTPDIIACREGRFIGLEVKRPGERPTPLQQHTLDQIARAGGIAAVVHSREEALDCVFGDSRF